jgi:hypothetical protein
MFGFVEGVATSIVAAFLVWLFVTIVWPTFQDKVLYSGVRIDGVWDICEMRADELKIVGKVTFQQKGSRITGTSTRVQTRQGLPSDRRFAYRGRIAGDQITLVFQDARGRDFDTGTYVFRLQNDCITMHGMATFAGKPENRIVSEARTLKKTPSPPAR